MSSLTFCKSWLILRWLSPSYVKHKYGKNRRMSEHLNILSQQAQISWQTAYHFINVFSEWSSYALENLIIFTPCTLFLSKRALKIFTHKFFDGHLNTCSPIGNTKYTDRGNNSKLVCFFIKLVIPMTLDMLINIWP